jgi:hypothetical protein
MADLGKFTISDDSNSLIPVVIGPIPSRRMHHFSTELLQSRDIWFSGKVQLSNSRYEEVCAQDIGMCELVVFVARNFGADFPFFLFLAPSRLCDLGIETDILVKPIFLSNVSEICLLIPSASAVLTRRRYAYQELFLSWKLPRPLGGLFEGVAIQDTRHYFQ